jgi:hypothetical protein
MTKKQAQEIDFLCKYISNFTPTEEEKTEYIEKTVMGKGSKLSLGMGSSGKVDNRIEMAKRSLDITIKDWARDMKDGQLAYWELIEGFENHPYAIKIVNTIRKGLVAHPSYGGSKDIAALAWLNSKHALTL